MLPCRLVFTAAVVIPAAFAQPPVWSLRPTTALPASGGHAMAFDAARRVTVVFGGNEMPETWVWNGTTWSLVATSGPNGRGYHTMAYDSLRQRIVLVTNPSGSVIETWEWDGSIWSQILTAAKPPVLGGYSIAFDDARGVTVLFGGLTGSRYLAETWEYDGATWVQRSSGGPYPRISAAMAFDGARREVVLFGGYSQIGSSFNLGDTWVWNGQYWREHFGIPGPSSRERAAMAFLTTRDRVVMFGGFDRQGPSYNDTWEWDGAAWALQNPAIRPSAGFEAELAYDDSREVAVLFGGGQTWEYVSGAFEPAAFAEFGTGCAGSGGVPRLSAQPGQRPRIGTPFSVDISSLGIGILVRPFAVLGVSRESVGGVPLPLELSFLQAPGCRLLVSIDAVAPLDNIGGRATWTIVIPNVPALAGGVLHQQALILDPGVNPLGLVASNAGMATLGL